jgi:hypothetical protein
VTYISIPIFSYKFQVIASTHIILTSTMFKPEEPSKDPKPEEHKEDEEGEDD